jgi:hypothetical protein
MIQRIGWRSNFIKAGDHVKAVVAPLLNGQSGGVLLEVTLPDGKKLETHRRAAQRSHDSTTGEAFTQVRRILLDQPQKPIDDVEPGFYGRSVGHWEGDTLVVDTIGVKENVRYQNTSHSKDMRIAERTHLVAPNILWNEITITDPVTLKKPWTITFAYRRMPGYTLLEYVCENNREFADQGLQKSTLGK